MKKQQPAVHSAVGPGMQVLGEVTFQEGLQVDGTVIGNVTAVPGQSSALIITETGRIEGVISADQVIISGTVIGPVEARESLGLMSTARVQGDVRYRTLEMQPGAVIAGQLQPQLTPPPNQPALPIEPHESPLSLGSPEVRQLMEGQMFADDDNKPGQIEPRFDL